VKRTAFSLDIAVNQGYKYTRGYKEPDQSWTAKAVNLTRRYSPRLQKNISHPQKSR